MLAALSSIKQSINMSLGQTSEHETNLFIVVGEQLTHDVMQAVMLLVRF